MIKSLYNLNMSMKKFLCIPILIFLVLSTQIEMVNAEFDNYCGLGAVKNSDGSCTPFWMDWSSDDGFVKEAQFIIQTADTEDLSGYSSHLYLAFTCTKRKLSVEVFATEFPIFPDANLYGNGVAQVKFDNGKPRNVGYRRTSNLESLFLRDAKTFAKSFSKAKSAVTFKIGNSDGYVLPTFQKLDFSMVAKNLKSAGCSF